MGMPLLYYVCEGRERTRMLACLCALLYYFRWHSHSAGSDLSQRGGQHVDTCLVSPALFKIWLSFGIVCYRRGGREMSLYGVVGNEEEGCSGRRAYDGRADASVYAGEATRCSEAGGGLEAGFQGVKGVKREVDRGTSQTTGLVYVSTCSQGQLKIM